MDYLPVLIEKRAIENPDRVYASIVCTSGRQDLTYAALDNAVNRTAWWLDEALPKRREYDVIVYDGPNDLRWVFLSLAAEKSGRQMMVLNPNNSSKADIKLFDETHSDRLVIAGHGSRFSAVIKARSPEVIQIPSFEYFLQSGNKYPYTPPSSEEEAWKTPLEISHTSGTTGNPKRSNKPVGYAQVVGRQRQCSDKGLLEGRQVWDDLEGKRFLQPFPMTWGAGLHCCLDIALTYEFIPVLLPPDTPQLVPTNLVVDCLKYADLGWMLPFHLKEIAKNPTFLKRLQEANFEMIGFAGAGLDKTTSDIVSKFSRIQPFYGIVDVGMIPILRSDPEDNSYIGLSPTVGCVFESTGEDLFELVLYRDRDRHRLVPLFLEKNLAVWSTNDVFRPHPMKKNFWQLVGRKDDLVKNSNLTKFNAHDVEVIIERHPAVRGAFMGGQGEKLPYLIVEAQISNDTAPVDKIWSAVEEANKILTDELQFGKSRVIIVDEGQLPRLGKGTINRRVVPEIFKEQIRGLGE